MPESPVVATLAGAEEALRAYPVMRQLRPHLSPEQYAAAMRRMMAAGYRLAVVEAGGEVRAAAGYRIDEMLHRGLAMYVDDLVTDERRRSEGYGKLLLDWLKQTARAAGCRELHLDSGVQREGAHRFYFREGLGISAYHFRITL